MKTVKELITELSNFPGDMEVKFFRSGFTGSNGLAEMEMVIVEYDQDTEGNPTFLMEDLLK